MSYVVAAYAAIWVLFIIYFFVVMSKTASVGKSLASMTKGAKADGQDANLSSQV
ncbi:MAG: hypothetical protein OEZ55_07645 [Nitrospinota bacterium]|nr:hypothetical protein [Nitrospinota bacterium]MDH5756521.1 hypothetical protein [Nitrospinota bacterium]